MRGLLPIALVAGGAIAAVAFAFGDLEGLFAGGEDHPAIGYRSRPARDSVSELNLELREGLAELKFEGGQGYLRSVLAALDVPVESQIVVFSKTSLMQQIITPAHPRSIFFNDSVAVAWVPGEPFVEAAAEDPQQGVVFYTLAQAPAPRPQFVRRNDCLTCHLSYASLGVPGTIVRSVFPAADGYPIRQFGDYLSDHRSPLAERWGGWYVTGSEIKVRHMGNTIFAAGDAEPVRSPDAPALPSLAGRFDTSLYLSPFSDIVALMVFEHEMHAMNLFTRAGWEIRLAQYQQSVARPPLDSAAPGDGRTIAQLLRDTATEVADYLLFVDEAPIAGAIRGSSGFAESFSRRGPRDAKGRSLRQFDLTRRMMRYPCSYMIYTAAFDSLPGEEREAIYRRMWTILSGQEKGDRYARLSFADRKDVVEILRATKKGLPDYFQPVAR